MMGEKQTDIYVEVREMEREDGAGVSWCARLKPAKSRYACCYWLNLLLCI
jgi:hypothetical protein